MNYPKTDPAYGQCKFYEDKINQCVGEIEKKKSEISTLNKLLEKEIKRVEGMVKLRDAEVKKLKQKK